MSFKFFFGFFFLVFAEVPGFWVVAEVGQPVARNISASARSSALT